MALGFRGTSLLPGQYQSKEGARATGLRYCSPEQVLDALGNCEEVNATTVTRILPYLNRDAQAAVAKQYGVEMGARPVFRA